MRQNDMGDAASGRRPRWRTVERSLETASEALARAATRIRAALERLPNFLALLFGATALWILVWAWYDVRILVDAFPSAPGYRPDLDVYWISTWWVLFPLTSLLIFRRHAWLPILALGIAGWEDVLFFWVQGRAVAAALPWLPQTPTAEALYLRAALFLAAAVPGAIVTRRRDLRIRFVPPEVVMLLAGLLGSFYLFVVSVPAYVAAQRLLNRYARGRGTDG